MLTLTAKQKILDCVVTMGRTVPSVKPKTPKHHCTHFLQIWNGHDEATNPHMAKSIVLSNTRCSIDAIRTVAFTGCWCPGPQSNTHRTYPYASAWNTHPGGCLPLHTAQAWCPQAPITAREQQIHYANQPPRLRIGARRERIKQRAGRARHTSTANSATALLI